MDRKIHFHRGELIIDETGYTYKSLRPFSLRVVKNEDFAGINIVEERTLKYTDWNYAFRFGAIGIVLLFGWNGIGYMINGLEGDLGRFFIYSSVVFAFVAGLGGYIIFFSFWDGLFGSKITITFLMKFFGQNVTGVVIASKGGQHIKFYLSETDKGKIDQILASKY